MSISHQELNLSALENVDLSQHFIKQHYVGGGAFGQVDAYTYRGSLREEFPSLDALVQSMGALVAVKHISATSEDAQLAFKFERQITTDILQNRLDKYQRYEPHQYPLVVGFAAIIGGKPSIISPYFANTHGNMNLMLRNIQPSFNPEEETAKSLNRLKEIFQGLIELHSQKIVHGDLTLQNCLPIKMGAKIIDFGYARKLNDANSIEENSGVNKRPKIPTYHSNVERIRYGKLSRLTDLYSMRIIIFEIVAGLSGDFNNFFKFVSKDGTKMNDDRFRSWVKNNGLSNDDLLKVFYDQAESYLRSDPNDPAKMNALQFLENFRDFLLPIEKGKSINSFTLQENILLWEHCFNKFPKVDLPIQSSEIEITKAQTTSETSGGYADADDSSSDLSQNSMSDSKSVNTSGDGMDESGEKQQASIIPHSVFAHRGSANVTEQRPEVKTPAKKV